MGLALVLKVIGCLVLLFHLLRRLYLLQWYLFICGLRRSCQYRSLVLRKTVVFVLQRSIICMERCWIVCCGNRKCIEMGVEIWVIFAFLILPMCSLVLSNCLLPVSPTYCCRQSGLVHVTRYMLLWLEQSRFCCILYVFPVTEVHNTLNVGAIVKPPS